MGIHVLSQGVPTLRMYSFLWCCWSPAPIVVNNVLGAMFIYGISALSAVYNLVSSTFDMSYYHHPSLPLMIPSSCHILGVWLTILGDALDTHPKYTIMVTYVPLILPLYLQGYFGCVGSTLMTLMPCLLESSPYLLFGSLVSGILDSVSAVFSSVFINFYLL